MFRLLRTAVAASASLTAACAIVLPAPTQAAGPDPAVAGACATVDETGGLPRCVALHRDAPALRVPAGSAERPYGVLARGGAFVTGGGRRLALSQGAAGSLADPRAYATTLYRATVDGGRVTALEAAMRVPAQLVMDRVFGGRLLVGRISRRQGEQNGIASFATRPTLPVAVRLGRARSGGAVPGSILNARRAVAVGGVCYRSLAEDRRADPLVDGFSSKITVERFPGMHAPFADQQVLGWSNGSSGMGAAFYPSLATLAGRDPLGRAWEVAQHGMPGSGPSLRLRFAARSATPSGC